MKMSWKLTAISENETRAETLAEAQTTGLMGALASLPLGRTLGKGAQGLPEDLKKYLEK